MILRQTKRIRNCKSQRSYTQKIHYGDATVSNRYQAWIFLRPTAAETQRYYSNKMILFLVSFYSVYDKSNLRGEGHRLGFHKISKEKFRR